MKALRFAAAAALLVLLTVIAFDLHRLADAAQPNSPLMVYLFGAPHPKNETLAEHDARLRRESAALNHDLDVTLGKNIFATPTSPQSPRQPSR